MLRTAEKQIQYNFRHWDFEHLHFVPNPVLFSSLSCLMAMVISLLKSTDFAKLDSSLFDAGLMRFTPNFLLFFLVELSFDVVFG